jgi:hypothetical protein
VNLPTLPTVEMPTRLLDATQTLSEREQELRAAEQAVAVAREGVKDGHRRDIEAIAAAREAGKADPKPRFEHEALGVLAEAEREAEVAQARLSQVRAEYERVAEEQRPIWRERVEQEWQRLDAKQRRRVRELGAGFEQSQQLQSAWRYLHALDTNPDDAERTVRKAMSPALAVQVDMTGLEAAIAEASADVVTARVSRAEADRLAASEAVSREMAEAVEKARQEREAEIERVRVRREALS